METKPFPLEDEFGDIIKKARLGRNLSVDYVASQTNIPAELLARLESYDRTPSEKEVVVLAQLLGLVPERLRRIVTPDYVPPPAPHQLGPFTIQTITARPGEANCYVVSDKQNARSCIVDPGTTVPRIEAVLDNGFAIAAVLVTHHHGDHTQSLEYFQAKLQPLADEPFTVWKTPGHTADSCSFLFPGFVFVGDLLFAGSVGRSLPGDNWYDTHLESGRHILSLPDSTVIFPGHGPATTVAAEKQNNPFFAF